MALGDRDRVATEHRFVSEQLADASQPEGFRLALGVLTYLTVVGLALPAVLITLGVEVLPWWGRATVTGLFLSGVGVLMRFLFVYAQFLSSEHLRTTLPRGPLGPLRR